MNKNVKILFIILGAVIGLSLIYGAHHEAMQSKKYPEEIGAELNYPVDPAPARFIGVNPVKKDAEAGEEVSKMERRVPKRSRIF
jgi:hypothetical protein